MALMDFTLSNARRFYSSMGNPLGLKGLICSNAPLSLSKRDDLPKKMITNIFFLITMLLLNLRSRRKRLRPIGFEYLGYVRDKRADSFKQTSTSRMKFSTRESNKVGSFSDCIRK